MTAATLPSKFRWVGVVYAGVVVLPAAWLALALEDGCYSEWLTSRSVVRLSVEPIVVLLLVWTTPAHDRFWSSVGLASVDGTSFLETRRGVGFWFHAAYSSLLVAAFVPWTASALHVAGALPLATDPTPVAFVVTTVALA